MSNKLGTTFGVSLGASLAALLVVLSTILTFVIILLTKSRARALKELNLLRERGGQRENITYEEINLSPSVINTSENVAYGHITNRR